MGTTSVRLPGRGPGGGGLDWVELWEWLGRLVLELIVPCAVMMVHAVMCAKWLDSAEVKDDGDSCGLRAVSTQGP